MKSLFFLLGGILFSWGSTQAQFLRSIKKFPDTGQNSSFTTTFGEDHDYLINPPRFSIWNNSIVVDSVTELMWQRGDGGEMTIENARIYADTCTLGGFTDWRLPNLLESYSILNHQNVNPSLDLAVFHATLAEYWWTSDRQFNDSSKIWCTNAGGGAGNHRKAETISAGGVKKFHPRLVRSVSAPSNFPQRFQTVGNGMLSDAWSGYIWQNQYTMDSLTWENALTYADTCTLGGFSDWRLPNIKELESIVDVSRYNPALPITFFANQGAQKYWASTSLPNAPLKAWIFDSQWGITTYDWKTLRHRVLLVRGMGVLPNSSTQKLNQPFQVFPNPVTNSFLVIQGLEANEGWKIWNQQGNLIAQGHGSQVETSKLPNGLYWINVANTFIPIVICNK